MKKIFSAALVVMFTLTVLKPNQARAEMPVKAKAFLTIAGYGTAGGALLGAASMAFGTSSRAIAQGASLGLYAGIIFGTYVLVSHHNKRYGSYDDYSSPYGSSRDIYGDDYQENDGGAAEDDRRSRGGFFDRYEPISEKLRAETVSLGNKERGSNLPPLYLNLVQYNF